MTATAIQLCERIVRTTSTCASQRGLAERFDGHHRRGLRADALRRPGSAAPRRRPWRPCCPSAPATRPKTCSVMACGFDPYRSERNPFVGACGVRGGLRGQADRRRLRIHKLAYLTFQEYFEKLRDEPSRWGKPFCRPAGRAERPDRLWRPPPSAARTPCPAPSWTWTCPPRWSPSPSLPPRPSRCSAPSSRQPGHPGLPLRRPQRATTTARRIAVGRASTRWCKAGKVRAAWAVASGGVAEGRHEDVPSATRSALPAPMI